MSGNSYDGECYKCGGTMYMYDDHKPHAYVSGECLECGFSYWTKEEQLTLDDVNDMRVNIYELEPLDKLEEQLNKEASNATK